MVDVRSQILCGCQIEDVAPLLTRTMMICDSMLGSDRLRRLARDLPCRRKGSRRCDVSSTLSGGLLHLVAARSERLVLGLSNSIIATTAGERVLLSDRHRGEYQHVREEESRAG